MMGWTAMPTISSRYFLDTRHRGSQFLNHADLAKQDVRLPCNVLQPARKDHTRSGARYSPHRAIISVRSALLSDLHRRHGNVLHAKRECRSTMLYVDFLQTWMAIILLLPPQYSSSRIPKGLGPCRLQTGYTTEDLATYYKTSSRAPCAVFTRQPRRR